ncbi:MAG TPA: DUF2203 domain-containing protein [Jiangellaceae bacterium]
MRTFSVDEAKAELARVAPEIGEVIELRADAAELAAAVQGGPPTHLGGVPELKAKQARLDELLTSFTDSGIEVKGFAPLLLDFPSELDGERVLLCWLEGDDELDWYHRQDLGFAGRRRLS